MLACSGKTDPTGLAARLLTLFWVLTKGRPCINNCVLVFLGVDCIRACMQLEQEDVLTGPSMTFLHITCSSHCTPNWAAAESYPNFVKMCRQWPVQVPRHRSYRQSLAESWIGTQQRRARSTPRLKILASCKCSASTGGLPSKVEGATYARNVPRMYYFACTFDVPVI
jgi:hypothetical protein